MLKASCILHKAWFKNWLQLLTAPIKICAHSTYLKTVQISDLYCGMVAEEYEGEKLAPNVTLFLPQCNQFL